MNLIDLFEDDIIKELPHGYGSEKDDQSVLKLSDLRKTRLTLDQLHRLRVLNDVRRLEKEQKVKKLSVQYKPPAQEGGGLM